MDKKQKLFIQLKEIRSRQNVRKSFLMHDQK